MLTDSQIKILETKNIFKFLKDMNSEWYEKWKIIANLYKKTIDRGPYFSTVAYTPHNFENHCMNIYGIIDDLIQNEQLGKSLNAEEIFILAVSVVLHDIIMAYNPESRENHSEAAKDFVIKQVYSKSQTVLSKCLSRNQAQAVAMVILGHSDIKTPIKVNTLELLPKKGHQPKGDLGEINVRTLGALLRLADELDITSKRIEGVNIEEYNTNEESVVYWKQCNLFQAVRPYSEKTTVVKLEVDEIAYVTDGDSVNNIKCIRNVKNKVQKELNNVNMILNQVGYLDGWTLSTVEISAPNDILELLEKLENTDPLEDYEEVQEKKKSQTMT